MATVTYAHHSLIQGKRSGALYGSFFTILLAIVFTCFHIQKFILFCFVVTIVYLKYKLLPSLHCYSNISTFITNPLTVYPVVEPKYYNNNKSLLSSITTVNKRFYTTDVKSSTLSPYWVTGFTDGEGYFTLKVSKSSSTRSGYNVIPEFKLELHNRDIIILRKIHSFFGVGIISENEAINKAYFTVQSARDLANVIIPHFDKYPLITQKQGDFLLFKEAIDLLLTGVVRSSIEGINSILCIKASMNRGLSDKLKIDFPNVKPILRPIINTQSIKNLHWLAGFVDGEGYFYVKSLKNAQYSTGYNVTLVFSVTQHSRDENLLTKFIDILGCGILERASTRPSSVNYRVNKFSDIRDKIIPFFNKYPLQSIKYMDFLDFSKAVDIVNNKGHLTEEGIKKINSLKSGMNRGRMNS